MKVYCIHCGQPIEIKGDQPATEGRCLKCGKTTPVPSSGRRSDASDEDRAAPRSRTKDLVILLLVLLILALLTWLLFGPASGARRLAFGNLGGKPPTLNDGGTIASEPNPATTDGTQPGLLPAGNQTGSGGITAPATGGTGLVAEKPNAPELADGTGLSKEEDAKPEAAPAQGSSNSTKPDRPAPPGTGDGIGIATPASASRDDLRPAGNPSSGPNSPLANPTSPSGVNVPPTTQNAPQLAGADRPGVPGIPSESGAPPLQVAKDTATALLGDANPASPATLGVKSSGPSTPAPAASAQAGSPAQAAPNNSQTPPGNSQVPGTTARPADQASPQARNAPQPVGIDRPGVPGIPSESLAPPLQVAKDATSTLLGEVKPASPADSDAKSSAPSPSAPPATAPDGPPAKPAEGSSPGDGSRGGVSEKKDEPKPDGATFDPKAGTNVLFVLDRSLSMRGAKSIRARHELVDTLDKLGPNKSFYVMFFPYEPMPAAGPLPATPDNIRAVTNWLFSTGHAYGSDPIKAVEKGLLLKPDTMWLLSDGEFSSSVPAAIRAANVSTKAHIHTVGFYDRGSEKAMRQISSDSGGTYRFVPPPAASSKPAAPQ